MKLIAHRGLSSKAPENTMPAFTLAALDDRYAGIECDVQTTKDGEFIVFHDEDLKRMTGKKKNIKALNLDELQAFTITAGRQVKKHPNLKIPTLKAFLDLCLTHQKEAIVEVKHIHHLEQLMPLIYWIETDYPDLKVTLISFQVTYLKYIRALSNIPLQLLVTQLTENLVYDARVNQLDLSLDHTIVNQKIINRLKKEGFKIGVWTVDYPSDQIRFEKMGIHYLTTNK